MKVFEVKLKLYLMQNIKLEEIQSNIGSFIDTAFGKDTMLIGFHNKNTFKNYCFDLPYPLEKDKVYKKDKIYTLRIRTINKYLAEFFNTKLVNCFDKNFKALVSDIKIIPKKPIEKLYSITPIIIKTEEGYWKNKISLEDFERRLKENLIKKYNSETNTKINENFDLYTGIKFINHKPIGIKYKNIKLLGDKISINISDDEIAQELAYLALGVGLSEMNARGNGFVNYKWF
ncbi:MAG: CRISPR-associated endoribonuclease Cas6 [Clostridium sp.]|nr:CRISPR-associated endoribonuclease Cas6 [Clostridium sp.]